VTNIKLGWIGLGVMGGSMCTHLLRAGYPLTVHTRTRAKAGGQIAAGAAWADSPRAVAEASDVVFTMVGFPDDVRAVVRPALARRVSRSWSAATPTRSRWCDLRSRRSAARSCTRADPDPDSTPRW
jgi:3-hydroxyisobutyrate dehydrogenase-like beta-hydroxyacid dehydrogenase